MTITLAALTTQFLDRPGLTNSTIRNTARLRKMKGKTKKNLFAYYLREQHEIIRLLFLFEAIVQVHPILTKRVDA